MACLCGTLSGIEAPHLQRDGNEIFSLAEPSMKGVSCDMNHLRTVLSCSKLTQLDLGFMAQAPSNLWQKLDNGGVLVFPSRLQGLILPGVVLPDAVRQSIQRLTALTRLEAFDTGLFPQQGLSNLQDLCVGGRMEVQERRCCTTRNAFCDQTLTKLTALTRLVLIVEMDKPLPTIFVPPTLRTLCLEGLVAVPALATMLAGLQSLDNLSLERTAHGPRKGRTRLILPANLSSLRTLTLRNAAVNTAATPATRFPILTGVCFRGSGGWQAISTSATGGVTLRPGQVAWLASLTNIQRLDLTGWRSWPDLEALWKLPLTELVFDQGAVMLAETCVEDSLPPPALPHLKCLVMNACNEVGNRFGKARLGHEVDEPCLEFVARTVRSLPAFERLSASEEVAGQELGARGLGLWRESPGVRGLLKGIDAQVVSLVALDPEVWEYVSHQGHGRVYQLAQVAPVCTGREEAKPPI